MSRFTALPVDGDAFVLERGERTILVDGGTCSRELVEQLCDVLPIGKTLDIVVCTHADEDHAQGLVDLFLEWELQLGVPLRVNEFWLPAVWSEVIAAALAGGLELDAAIKDARKLLERALAAEPLPEPEDEIFDGSFDVARIDAMVDAIADAEDHDAPPETELDEHLGDSQIRGVAEDFGHLAALIKYAYFGSLNLDLTLEGLDKLDKLDAADASEALDAYWLSLQFSVGERLSRIVASALANGATIRWFDYGAFKRRKQPASGGIADVLEPVNCVEVRKTPRRRSLMTVLALSTVNIESLVFVAPERDDEPAVLFTADSPFMWSSGHHRGKCAVTGKRPEKRTLLTAPHHGAATNDRAYASIEAWAPNHQWVRSGGQMRHPDGAFKHKAPRICTWCPHKPHDFERVTAETDSQGWRVVSPQRPCDC